jgi:uroporphyrinogen decarboxylase
MTRRERVIAALQHKETDYIPFHCDFTSQELENIERYLGYKGFTAYKNLHIHSWFYDAFPKELPDRPEHFRDHFGVIWNRSGADKDIGIVEDRLIGDIEHITYQFPDVDEQAIRLEMERLMATKEDRFTITGISYCMYERAWSLCKVEDLLMYMITNPQEIEMLFDKICEYNLRVIDIFLEYNIDGIIFGDDWGQQKGFIMGPAHWRKYIKPQIAKMYRRVKDKGLFVIQHSCGDISELFPDLIEIGLDMYQTFQPEIYDIEKVKEQYGDVLCFWGGISTQCLLPFAAPDEVKKETARIMKIMGKNGGYLASPTHAVPQDVPPENVIAMLDVFANQKQVYF